jgi:hypothetical protein
MALPELLINSPTPGKREALTTLNAELSEAGLEMEWVGTVPTGFQYAGQFRVTIGSEIILCEGKAESTKKVKILERGAEGTTKVAHPATTTVWGLLTAGALKAYTEGTAFSAALTATFGQVELKFAAGHYVELKVTHGLGKTPKYIFLSVNQDLTANSWQNLTAPAGLATSTQFTIQSTEANETNITAQVTVNWMAVG